MPKKAHTEEQIVLLLRRAIEDKERGLGEMNVRAGDAVLQRIAAYSSGDARSAYNVLQIAAGCPLDAHGRNAGPLHRDGRAQ